MSLNDHFLPASPIPERLAAKIVAGLCLVGFSARPRLVKKITKEGILKPKLTVAGQAESLRMAMRREEAKKG